MFIERRKTPRVEKKFKITAIAIDAEQGDSLFTVDSVWSHDLNGTGLGLVTQVRCVVGLPIDIEFRLPGKREAIKAKGRVVWSKLDDEAKGLYRVGVAYESIDEADRRAITSYLKSEAKKTKKAKA